MNRSVPKEKVSRLPGGGFIIRTRSIDLILLNRKKIQVSYPKDLQLSRVKGFVDRAFKDLERRDP
jgi:hypothetical protein